MPGFLRRTKRRKPTRTKVIPSNIKDIEKEKENQETLERLRRRFENSRSGWVRKGEWDLGAPSTKIHPENKFRNNFRDIEKMTLNEILAEIAQLEKELGAESKEESGHGKKRRTKKHNKRKTKRKTKRGHRGKSPKKKGGRRSRRRRR